jgi:hypothetical protein
MKDRQLKTPDIFGLLISESDRQVKKWGIQDHDVFTWLAIAAEEFGELAAAINEWHFRNGLQSEVIKEAVQSCTLLLKIAEIFIQEGRGSRGTEAKAGPPNRTDRQDMPKPAPRGFEDYEDLSQR